MPQFLLFPFFCALQASGGKHEASTRKAGGEWREARGEWREARGECEKGARRVEGSTRRVRERREGQETQKWMSLFARLPLIVYHPSHFFRT